MTKMDNRDPIEATTMPRKSKGRTRSNGYFRGRGRPSLRSLDQRHDNHSHDIASSSYANGLDNGIGLPNSTEYPKRYRSNISNNVWMRLSSSTPPRRGSSYKRSPPRAGGGRSRLGTCDIKDVALEDGNGNGNDCDGVDRLVSESICFQREKDIQSFDNDQQGKRILKRKHSYYARDQKNYYKSNENLVKSARTDTLKSHFTHTIDNTSKDICQSLNVDSLRKPSSKPLEDTNKEVELIEKLNLVPNASSNHESLKMGDINVSTGLKKGLFYYKLMKDKKIICRMQCTNPPIQLPTCWNLEIQRLTSVKGLADLPQFSLFPAFEDRYQKEEWPKFMSYLYTRCKVAIVEFEKLKICILPPEGTKSSEREASALNFKCALVAYDVPEAHVSILDQRQATSALKTSEHENETQGFTQPLLGPSDACLKDQRVMPVGETVYSTHLVDAPVLEPDIHVKGSNSDEKGTCTSVSKYPEAASSHQDFNAREGNSTERNYVRADPSYLKTLGQAHSGWVFGAIAELVDNARDANASRLEIAIENVYCKTAGCEIPMLSLIDDGNGMNDQEILRMVSFGHKQPDEENADRIGRFGVGFKTGTMRLGRDALVLTQTTKSRSIAFLSQSLNEGKDNVEIPIVSYRRQAQFMDFDTSVQSKALAKYNLKAIKNFSPFNEYLIGEKAALFRSDTGTQIYIWNLESWGSDYMLEWQAGMPGKSSFHHGDILIRSRRVRTRPGQTSKKVFLDYSLRAYLEVIFLEPRMKIYIQGALVKSRPLAKSLNNTAEVKGEIMGKPVHLTLGRCQEEWEYVNSGVFLYWHGRLIEAYKRVGGMIHSTDMGRGVIGVIDVTELMDDGNGGVWVHSNKQGFQDCEPYARLEEWLGNQADEYWDTYFDVIQLKKGKTRYKPDHEWVQCEKCRKWRMLDPGFDSKTLVGEWFCYMKPFEGRCEMPERKPDPGVITIGTKRRVVSTGLLDCKEGIPVNNDDPEAEKINDDTNNTAEEYVERPWSKRLRRGPALALDKK